MGILTRHDVVDDDDDLQMVKTIITADMPGFFFGSAPVSTRQKRTVRSVASLRVHPRRARRGSRCPQNLGA